jgi:PadR family transcriptional regulator, regulatory protein PadR
MLKAKQKKDENNTPNAGLPSVSRKELLILEMLIQGRRELYGLEMVEASNGDLKRGTIYVTLQRMQEKGFVDSKLEPRIAPEIGIPRRLYSVTGYGQRVYRTYQTALALMIEKPLQVSETI